MSAPRPVGIRLLGHFELAVDGCQLDQRSFARRDPARLVKLLALAPGRSLHREQVVDALWPDAPALSVANRLHKAGHFVRRVCGMRDSVTMRSDTVSLFPSADVSVDVLAFDRLADRALREGDRQALDDALAWYRGDLLPLDPYEDWTFHHRQRLQLRHRELLRRAGRFDELVELDPTDEGAHVAVMERLLRAGDRVGVLRQFDHLIDVLERELGVGPSTEAIAMRDQASHVPAAMAASGLVRAADLATQQVHFCTTVDGVRLAYAASGSGPPLVKAANWLNHLDHDWDSPVWGPCWQALSQHHTLIRYDERGCGLSDWDVDRASFTLDAWVRDLETVVDALGLERFPLLGISQGGPIAITYAARHPERVSHVIVYGTSARATWAKATADERRELSALGELIKASWGSDQPGFRQVYDARFLPDGPIELWRAFDELQRRSTSARNAYSLWRAFGSLDCTADARRLQAPLLILHATGDLVWPVAEAEELHALAPGSRLVRLESRNHILQPGEPAFDQLLDEVDRFLRT